MIYRNVEESVYSSLALKLLASFHLMPIKLCLWAQLPTGQFKGCRAIDFTHGVLMGWWCIRAGNRKMFVRCTSETVFKFIHGREIILGL